MGYDKCKKFRADKAGPFTKEFDVYRSLPQACIWSSFRIISRLIIVGHPFCDKKRSGPGGFLIRLPIFRAKPAMIFLLIPALLLLSNKSPCNKCQIGKDTLTGRSIYLTYDVEPECEGGRGALLRRMNKTVFISDSLMTGNYDSHYTVSFIVEAE
jgi:hypothetical protein